MEEFRKFELEITKDNLALLEIAKLYRKLLVENRQGEAFALLEKSKYRELEKELKQKVVDFKEKINNTPTTVDNVDFLRKSKQFLSQFKTDNKEVDDLFFSKIDLLIEEKNTALKEKDFKKANLIRAEIMSIQTKVLI